MSTGLMGNETGTTNCIKEEPLCRRFEDNFPKTYSYFPKQPFEGAL